MIKDVIETGFSTRYSHLVDLMQKESVICFVDYGDRPCRDIAKTAYDSTGKIFEIRARGIGYLWAESPQEFIEQCRKYNVSFLPPSAIAHPSNQG